MKKKNNSPQAIINRNNRARGAKFEKTVAEILSMYIVPYSGSNARFGYGDIRDVEGIEGGRWLGECKSMKVDDDAHPEYVIDHKWLSKNAERASMYNAMPFLAFTRFAKPHKWIMVDAGVFGTLVEAYSSPIPIYTYPIQMANKNVKNYHIPENVLLNAAKFSAALKVWFKGDIKCYYVLAINTFNDILVDTKIHAKYGVR